MDVRRWTRLYQLFDEAFMRADRIAVTRVQESTERRQPVSSPVSPNLFGNSLEDFQREPAAILQATAVLIGATIDSIHKELNIEQPDSTCQSR